MGKRCLLKIRDLPKVEIVKTDSKTDGLVTLAYFIGPFFIRPKNNVTLIFFSDTCFVNLQM